MAFATIPDQAELNIALALGAQLSGNEKVELYVNDVTPDEDTVFDDLTLATYDGYGNQAYDTAHAAEVGGKAEFGSQTFTFTGPASGGPVDIYGWCLRGVGDGPNGMHMVARLSGAPRSLADDTESITLVINWRLWDAHQP